MERITLESPKQLGNLTDSNPTDDFIVETIRNNCGKYGHCPFIYIWLNTDVYKPLENLQGRDNAIEYIKIHDLLQNRLLKLETEGLIYRKFDNNYDGEVWMAR